jgi:hypothetical protein
MTSPEDDGLEDALRRALSDAASEVEPGTDGLDKIRTRIAGRPPRPWLLSVLSGAVDRVRNWTWRGHWAWPSWLSRLAEVRWPRLRRGNFPGWGNWSLRLAAVFAAVAVIASVTLGVRPFRNAILQASTALQGGGSGSHQTTAGTEGNGTQTVEGGTGTSPASPVPSGQSSTGSAASASRTSNGAKSPASAAKCQPSALPVVSSTKPSLTDDPSASATSPATATPSPAASTQASAQPVYTNTSPVTCPVAAPTQSPTQSPTPTPSAAAATPTDTPTSSDPTTSGDPTGGYPTSGDPTSGYPTSSDPTSGDPTSSDPTSSDPTSSDPTPTTDATQPSHDWQGPSDPPSGSWTDRHSRDSWSPHVHRR